MELRSFWTATSNGIRQETRDQREPTWMGAVNRHGKMGQFMLWNCNSVNSKGEREVKCFHANFWAGAMTQAAFQTETLRWLRLIHVIPIAVMQDSQNFAAENVMPLLHMSCHVFKFMREIEIDSNAPVPEIVWFPMIFEDGMLASPGLSAIVGENRLWQHDVSCHYDLRDRFNRDTFSIANERELIEGIRDSYPAGEEELFLSMQTFVEAVFLVFRLWWQREGVEVAANTDELIQVSVIRVQLIIGISNFLLNRPLTDCCCLLTRIWAGSVHGKQDFTMEMLWSHHFTTGEASSRIIQRFHLKPSFCVSSTRQHAARNAIPSR